MSVPGSTISLTLVLLIVLTAGGTAVTTVLYHTSAQDLRAQNEGLRAENAEFRKQLNEPKRERREANKRIVGLESQLDTRIQDVETLSSELKDQDQEPNVTRAQFEELQRTDRGRTIVRLKQRLIILCNIVENRDIFACDGFVENR